MMTVNVYMIVGVATGAVVWMLFFYGMRRVSDNPAVVDVGWAFGMGLAAVGIAWVGTGDPVRRVLLAVLAGGWSARLGFFLLRDRILSGVEDGRYRALMNMWGNEAERRLFVVFMAQAAVITVFAVPFLVVAQSTARPFNIWDMAAIAVWLVSVLGEALADWQLARWRANPDHHGRTCRRGLWRWSRHPNYFFEWVHWWAYVLLAVGAPGWYLTLLGPVLMFLFLHRVTGIPYTEAQALKSRGEDYRQYQQNTSAFFPWFPGGA